MKNESVISRIISAIKGNKIAVRENLFYDTVKGIVDFGLDDLITLRVLQSSAGQIVRKAFTTTNTSTGALNINWQTDIPDGQVSTYAALMGNYVEPQCFVIRGGAGGGFAQGSANVSWTTDGSGNVLIVTIAIGSPQNGYVRFG